MKSFLKRYIFALVAFAGGVNMLNASSLAEQGDSAYKKEDYRAAVELYNQAIKEDGVSTDLYYNLGNAYYRTGDLSSSILSYERALRLDPSNSDAKSNLDFVNTKIADKKGESGSFISNTIDSIACAFHSNVWAWLAVILFALTMACGCLYVFGGIVLIKKIGFFGGIILLLISGISVFFSFRSKAISTDASQAIITAESTVLSTVPRTPLNRDEEAMLLHEGTKVRIIRSIALSGDSAGEIWHEVDVDNRHRAWINGNDIEKIIR